MSIKKILPLLMLASILLSACGAATPEPTEIPVTPTSEFTGAGEELVCLHPMLPADVSATWGYTQASPDNDIIEYVNTVEDVQPKGFTLITNQDETETIRTEWRCSTNGLTSLSPIFGAKWSKFILTEAPITEEHLTDNSGTTFPGVIKLEDTWTQVIKTSGKTMLNGEKVEVETTYTYNFTATTSEELTVTAIAGMSIVINVEGNIEYKIKKEGAPQLPRIQFESAQWYLPGIGLAKSVSVIKVGDGSTSRVETTELTSYLTTR